MTKLKKFKLKEIETIQFVNSDSYNMLHDITVEENHSYHVNKHIVHNCSTTVHTGIGYPMASLISECYAISSEIKKPAKIVADGGMQNYSDIIKALALGADYVMVGSIFNKAIESCGDNYLWGKLKVNHKIAKFAYDMNIPVYKKFRGMSTKEVQRKWGKQHLTTSEGVVRYRRVEYSLAQWIENFEAYLRSAMSYTNSKNLSEFIGIVETIKISDNSYNRFKK
jgi:glutamate synthase domain-containing protein 2